MEETKNILPDSVVIGPFTYVVIETDEVLTVDNLVCQGMIDYNFHTIKISSDIIGPQQQIQTLWHEIVHGINHYLGLEMDEDLTDKFALGLLMLHQQNGILPGQNPDLFPQIELTFASEEACNKCKGEKDAKEVVKALRRMGAVTLDGDNVD